jgi:hypothetical protein
VIIFHRVLIGTSILFFGGFGIWAILGAREAGDVLLGVLGGASLVITALLSYYLKNLQRFLGR